MQEYDMVELINDKSCYAEDGVYKGMTGWICDERNLSGTWLVCFAMDEYFTEYPIIAVNEEDLKFLYNAETLSKEDPRV